MVYFKNMKANHRLAEYLEKIVGNPVTLRQLPAGRVSGLPVFLTADYRFLEWRWLDQLLILAHAESDNVPSATDLKSRHTLLVEQLKCPVVFVYPALDAYRRNRFVHLGLPFIVPGLQLFIPPFVNLCEQFQRLTKSMKLSAAAQVTVLFQLLRPQADGSLLNQWAERLGYSAMTMTKVRDELVANRLCVREDGAKPRGLRFLHQDRSLWEAALPFLRSPVRRTCWAKFQKPPPAWILAGLTALSKRSLLEDDPLPTYACHVNEWKRMIASRSIRKLDHHDEASASVECWRYDPGLLAEDAMVDRLSLFLSLADSADERVRLASNSLLDGMTW
ncbi:MAG: hypothetical protein HY343_10920 [Lentisphaerae bacterium]|nr:hypothetical protein [Lentisphaerota bacterium]